MSEVVPTAGAVDTACALRGAGPRGAIARGLGRSYNDAAQNAGGLVLQPASARLELDPVTGVVDVGGAVSLDALMRVLVPKGWFVPVTPGTRFVTVGGAVASDVHGKNHHVDGSFADHLDSIDLLTPDGVVRTIGPEGDPDDVALFWATAGGMGLTGVVLGARLRCLPIETSAMLVETIRTADLADTMQVLADADHRCRYSVAWVDLIAGGDALGRGVVTLGDHAPAAVVSGPDRLAFAPRRLASVPSWFDVSLLNGVSIRAFNELWYRKAPGHRVDELQSIGWYFHPLDAVGRWNRFYGRRGFVQYQMVVPDTAAHAVRTVVERFVARGVPSFLAVLKRFGAGNDGPLSFPMAGWTLALDVPAGVAGLDALLDEIDDLVVAVGGRVYLAKDGRVRPELLPRMYPRLEEWRDVVAGLGHGDRLGSDLDRRLGLRRTT